MASNLSPPFLIMLGDKNVPCTYICECRPLSQPATTGGAPAAFALTLCFVPRSTSMFILEEDRPEKPFQRLARLEWSVLFMLQACFNNRRCPTAASKPYCKIPSLTTLRDDPRRKLRYPSGFARGVHRTHPGREGRGRQDSGYVQRQHYPKGANQVQNSCMVPGASKYGGTLKLASIDARGGKLLHHPCVDL